MPNRELLERARMFEEGAERATDPISRQHYREMAAHYRGAVNRADGHAGARDGTLRGGRLPTREYLTMTVWIYVNTSKQVGDKDHLKVFANEDAAETWLQENDPEGVAFEYEVLD